VNQHPGIGHGAAAVLATLTFVAGVVVGGSAATGRLPLLSRAWGTVASSVGASPLLPEERSSQATDTGAPSGDAGVPWHRQATPLSSAQLGAPLVHGTFVAACGAPDDMKIVVNVTVKMGRAVGVAVETNPPNPGVASCVEQATRDLQWDVSPKTDHVTVTY
jgi:hypothetical protein